MKRIKKVAVIGSGIAGLTAAIYAAKAGFQVDLYEKHSIVGGECTGWDRKGYHIDNCIHWMIGTRPGTELHKLWHTVGALGEGVEIKRQKAMYASELNGERLVLWQDLDKTRQEMIALSPEDKVEIEALIAACKLGRKVQIPAKMPSEFIGGIEGVKMLWHMKESLKLMKLYKGMSVEDLMLRFKHPLIRCAISDFCTKESMASSFPMAYGNFASGDGGIPKGGSRAMAFRMRDTFEKYGGKVHTSKGVSKIEIKNHQAIGIRLEDGQKVSYDYIIPTCDASVIFGKLLPKQYMPQVLQEMYANPKAYPIYNTFQVALEVDDEEDVVGEEVNINCPELVFTEGMGERIVIKIYSYEPEFAPKGKQIIQTLQGGSADVYAYWQKLYQNKENYKKVKLEIAQQTLEVVEKRFPQYKGKLKVLDAWTPMTYSRYCNAYKGYYQSCQITKYSKPNAYPSPYVEGISNVFWAGQWIAPPGGLPGAAISGKYAVQRILKKEHRAYDNI